MIIIDCQDENKIPLFIFGNESTGITDNIINLKYNFDKYYILELKQKGVLKSFNVSNVLSIICYKIMEIFNTLK